MKIRVDKRIDVETIKKDIESLPQTKVKNVKTKGDVNIFFIDTPWREQDILNITGVYSTSEPEVVFNDEEEEMAVNEIKHRIPSGFNYDDLMRLISKKFPDSKDFRLEQGVRKAICFTNEVNSYQDVANYISYLEKKRVEDVSRVIEKDKKMSNSDSNFAPIIVELKKLFVEAAEQEIRPKEEERNLRLSTELDSFSKRLDKMETEITNRLNKAVSDFESRTVGVLENVDKRVQAKNNEIDKTIDQLSNSAKKQEEIIANSNKALDKKFDDAEVKVNEKVAETLSDINKTKEEFQTMISGMKQAFEMLGKLK